MQLSFEELWNECEKLHSNNVDLNSVLDELILKVNLYKFIDEKEILNEEKQKAKAHIIGELLLSLSKISVKDNINIYESLINTFIAMKNINL